MNPLIDVPAGLAAAAFTVLVLRHAVATKATTYSMGAAVLTTAAFGGGIAAAAIAAGVFLARFHPVFATLPAAGAAYWIGPAPAAMTAAWALAGPGAAWTALPGVAAAALLDPIAAGLAVLVGAVAAVAHRHPANAAIARWLARAGTLALPLPALALFALATVGRASVGDWRIFQLAAAAVLLGIAALYGAAGVGVRFLATDGRGAAWTAALVTAAAVASYLLVAQGPEPMPSALAATLTGLAFAAAPALSRLPLWHAIPIVVLPALVAL